MDLSRIYFVINSVLDAYLLEGVRPEDLLTYLNTDKSNYEFLYNRIYRKLNVDGVQFESDTLRECLVDSIRDKVALLNDTVNKK